MMKLGPMKTYETIFLGDFKYYCKMIKRDIFNDILDKSNSHAFPKGKIIKHRYEDNLENIFHKFRKHIVKDVYGKPIKTEHTKIIKVKGRDVYIQTNVTFEDIIWHIIHKQVLDLHFKRILKCYKVTRECIEFVERSNHEDLAVKCNRRHHYYLKRIFNRFSLNLRCLEVDDSYDEPKMVIIHHNGGDSK